MCPLAPTPQRSASVFQEGTCASWVELQKHRKQQQWRVWDRQLGVRRAAEARGGQALPAWPAGFHSRDDGQTGGPRAYKKRVYAMADSILVV